MVKDDIEIKYEVVKLSPKMKRHFDFLENHKKYVGLSDWIIILMASPEEIDDYADVETDIFEKTIKVTLSKKFMKLSVKVQENILFHELVHGRYSVKVKKIEQLSEVEEEFFINDIVRGFERFGCFDKKSI